MRNEVSYEYVAEPVDVDGDIIDPLFGDTLDAVRGYVRGYECDHVKFALVRNVGNDIDGLQDREYAYFDGDYHLPDEFDLGTLVPQSFIKLHGGQS